MGLTFDREGVAHTTSNGIVRRLSWRRLRTVAFAVTVLIFLLGLPSLAAGQGRGLLTVAGYHLYIVCWLLVATFWTRTTSVRDVAGFWFIGMFPVVFVVYLLTAPSEAWLGDHPFHIAFLVPFFEEFVRLIPLLVWGLLLGRHQVTASVSDLVVLGFAIGGGFAFHEDALWRRVGGTGLGAGEWGVLFPTFSDYTWNPRVVVGHGGWGLLLGFGVGMYLVHRKRPFAWLLLAVPAVITVLDHARANAWGGGGELLDLLLVNGHLPAGSILLAVIVAVGHDLYVQRWATARDRLFPAVTLTHHLSTMRDASLTVQGRMQRLLAEVRYRRYRLAAFIDLYRVRARSGSAGDRTHVVRALTGLATGAGLWAPQGGWRPSSPRGEQSSMAAGGEPTVTTPGGEPTATAPPPPIPPQEP